VTLDRYGLVVLRKGITGTVHISLHGRCPEQAFGLAADTIDWIEPATLRRAGVDLSISAPGEYGAPVTAAVAVAVVGAISAYLDLGMSREEIAREAERLHTRSLGWTTGWEHCSAQGGIHLLRRDDRVTRTEDLSILPGLLDTLSRRLLLFSSGEKSASSGQGEWDSPRCVKTLYNLRSIAEEMCVALEEGSLDLFGKLLDLAWSHESLLPGNKPGTRLEAGYRAALDAGALGGRAVSPSMLLLYASRITHDGIERTMSALGWERVPVRLDAEGAHSSGDGDTLSHHFSSEETSSRSGNPV
jgi:D-glycero-alpha-D-manno-heptose-7-phosphate kinase